MNSVRKDMQKAIGAFNRKNIDESIELFEAVLEDDPTNPEAHYYLGLVYARDGRHEKAVVHLKAVVDTGISFIFTHQCRMVLGYIYYTNEEYDRAEYEFSTVLKANFNIIQVRAALSAIYYKQERYDEAFEEADHAFSMDNFNLNAKNTYAFLLCDLDIDPERGVELLREVVRLKPENPAYLDSLGWGYYKKGDTKAAILSLKRAMELSDSEEIQNHYAIVVGKKKDEVRGMK